MSAMSLTGLTPEELAALVAELGEAPYRAKQIFRWVQAKGAGTYDAMTDLPLRLRDTLGKSAAQPQHKV